MIQRLCKRTSLFFLVLALLAAFSGCSSSRVIINGLEERDANEIIVFLSTKGIVAYKIRAEIEGPGAAGGGLVLWNIAVPRDQAVEAMSILNANGLPRRRTQNLLDLFTSGGLVPSEMQETIRYQAGLAEQISGTIRKIDGILDADVQLSFPEEDPLNPKESKGEVTASVFVKHQGVLDDPNSHLVTKIRRLVASSVQGLKFENVTIISDRGRFAEGNVQARLRSLPGNVELVRVWGVTVAQQAVGRFQTIFFTIITLLALFVLTTVWMLWKVLPVAKQCGGVKTLFFFRPYEVAIPEEEEITAEEETPSEEEKPKEGEGEEGPGEPGVQENIEST